MTRGSAKSAAIALIAALAAVEALRPGRYRLRAQALLNTRLGPAVSTSFRIVRG
jgi:hypothetical protein